MKLRIKFADKSKPDLVTTSDKHDWTIEEGFWVISTKPAVGKAGVTHAYPAHIIQGVYIKGDVVNE